jgi:O-antigen/teichoic acid export membrane protein
MSSDTIIKTWIVTLLSTATMTGAGFVSSILTVRMLGPEGRGLFSTALLIGALAGNLAQFGLASSYVYHVGAGRRFAYAPLLLLSLLAVSGGAMVFAALGLHFHDDARLSCHWELVIGFAMLSGVQVYFLLLSQLRPNLHFFNILRISLILGNLAMLLGLRLYLGPEVDFTRILTTQLTVLVASALAGTYWVGRHKLWRVSREREPAKFGQIARYAAGQHGTSILYIVMQNADKAILIHLASVEQFGFYMVAFTVSRLIGSLQDSLSTVLFARFAGKDTRELGSAVRIAFRVTFLPLLGIAGLTAILSPWLITTLYGAKFAPVSAPFAILLIECVISAASYTLSQHFAAAGRPSLSLWREMAATLPLLVGAPLLSRDNAYELMSFMMLGSSLLRLLSTGLLFKLALKEGWPRFWPRLADYGNMINAFSCRAPRLP